MRVLEHSHDRLVIEEKPWFWGLFFIVFMLAFTAGGTKAALACEWIMVALAGPVVLGVGALAAFSVERVWPILDRVTETVELRRRNVRGFRREVYALSDLAVDGIFVQSNEGTQRIALRIVTLDEPLPLTSYYQSGGNVRGCAETARSWLAAAPA